MLKVVFEVENNHQSELQFECEQTKKRPNKLTFILVGRTLVFTERRFVLRSILYLIVPPSNTTKHTHFSGGEYNMPYCAFTSLVVPKDADVVAYSNGREQSTASSVGCHFKMCDVVVCSRV